MRWRDASVGRSVLLREGLLADAAGVLAGEGWAEFELVTSERALVSAPGLRDAASRTHLAATGQVPEVAAAILPAVGSEHLVACGGGRVIDAAKAVAAVRGGRVAAIPTTLSGADRRRGRRRAGAAGAGRALPRRDPLRGGDRLRGAGDPPRDQPVPGPRVRDAPRRDQRRRAAGRDGRDARARARADRRPGRRSAARRRGTSAAPISPRSSTRPGSATAASL